MHLWPRLASNIAVVIKPLRNVPSLVGRRNKRQSQYYHNIHHKPTSVIEDLSVQPLKRVRPLVHGLGYTLAVLNVKLSQANNNKGVSMATLTEADKLFDDSKFDDLLELLKKQPGWENDAQILWRVARCEFQLSKKVKDQKDKHAELVNTAYEHVKKSLELDDKNGLAHKWAAILLDAVSTLKGTKERVLQVLNVRNHMEKAIEYAPTDPTSYYLLGEWHFSCYQVSWWERKIANIAFGKLPDADMEVALKMFEKAEEVDKDFYSKNKLMLAKTLLELKRDKERAITLLDEVVAKYNNSDKWDDKEAVEEASKLIKQHK